MFLNQYIQPESIADLVLNYYWCSILLIMPLNMISIENSFITFFKTVMMHVFQDYLMNRKFILKKHLLEIGIF